MLTTGRNGLALLMMIMLLIPSVSIVSTGMEEAAGSDNYLFYSKAGPEDLPDLWTRWGMMKMDSLIETIPHSNEDVDGEFWIVQFNGPIRKSSRDELTNEGYIILEYLPDFAYVLSLGGRNPASLLENEDVLAACPFPSGMKMDPELYEDLGNGNNILEQTDEKLLLIDTFSPIDGIEDELLEISSYVEKGSSTRYLIGPTISSRDDLLSIQGIKHIEPYYQMELHNELSKDIISVQEAWDDLGLNGSGQIVTIADTGLDTGADNPDVNGDIHLDFDNRATIVNWAGTSPDDGHSHGTHVTGSVAGGGARSNGNIKGMAPNASIFFQAIMADNGALVIPANTSELYQQAYDNGSRIHTNSWGSSVSGAYTSRSQDVDWFLFNHPDMIILYSAGNSGVDWSPEDGRIDNDNIGAPASAKNCITVGAAENNRPTGGYQFNWGLWNGWRNVGGSWSYESKYPQNPVYSDLISDDENGLAAFSSRGPTNDGRIKPDIVAPGTNILSCRSSITGAGTGWGIYDSYYVYMGGTSMSTPITAGATVLVREFYNGTLGLDAPSGALLKATLINGAMDLTPGQYGAPNLTVQEIQGRPDMHQGWGRINISESLDPENGNLAFIDDKEGIWTGADMVSNIQVSSSSKDLKVTLVYSDHPGATYASKELVNDLDLTLVAPNGTKYHGNDFAAPFNDTRDRVNPVEGITMTSPVTGTWKVIISGYNIPMGPQHFAVVASGAISNFSSVIILDREYYSTEGDTINIRVVDQDLIGQGSITVTVNSTTNGTGITVTLAEVGGSTGLFEGMVQTRNSSTGNSSSVQVSHDDEILVSYTDTDPSGTFSTVAIAKDPVRVSLWYRPELRLVQSEGEIVHFEGIIDSNVTAWWKLEGLSPDWIRFHDDGNLTYGDLAAFDLNISGIWNVPANVSGNYTLITMVEDPFLGNRTYTNFELEFNGSMPRYPRDLHVTVLPAGNSVAVSWSASNETDLSYYNIYTRTETTTVIAPAGWNLIASTLDVADHLNVTGLVDGTEYSFRVSVVDRNGNESSLSVPYNAIPYDIIAPDITMTTTPRTIVGDILFTFSGSMDLDRVQMQFYNDSNENGLLDDGEWEEIGEGDPSGVLWDTRTEYGGPGDINSMFIRYRGLDEVNNTSDWVIESHFRVDNTGPASVSIVDPPSTIMNTGSYYLTGDAEGNGWTEVWINDMLDSNNTCNGLGGFNFYMNLTEGLNIVILRAYDQFGAGPTNRTYRFTLDTADPIAMLDVPDQSNITLNIQLEPLWFNSTSYDQGVDPNFTHIENITWKVYDPFGGHKLYYGIEDLPLNILDLGTYVIVLSVRDPARNFNTTVLGVEVIDNSTPIIDIDGDLIVNEDDTVSFEYNVTDNDPFWYRRIDDPVHWEFRGMGMWMNITTRTALISFPNPGTYSVTLTITDGGGNSANLTRNITVLDQTSPEGNVIFSEEIILGIPETFAQNLTDNDVDFPSGATFHWNLSFVDGPPENWWTQNFEGETFQFNFTQAGYYMLTLTGIDASGNEREFMVPFKAIGDLTPPLISEVLPAANASFQFHEDLKITIIFNEALNTSTVNSDNIVMTDPEGNAIDTNLLLKSGSEIQVIPGHLDLGKTYTLSVGVGLMDLWDNHLQTGMDVNYTIRTLFGLDLADGVFPNNVDKNFSGNEEDIYNISLRFTNPVSISTVSNALTIMSIKIEDINGVPREARSEISFFIVKPGEDEFSVIISIQLDMGTRYNITLDTKVRDIFDYQLDNMYQWEFETYIPPSSEPEVPEDEDEDDKIPEWALNPTLWIILAIIVVSLLIILFIVGKIRHKKKMEKIWQEGSEGTRRGSGEPYDPVADQPTVVPMESTGSSVEDATVLPPPPDYSDLYSSLYNDNAVNEVFVQEEVPAPPPPPRAIDWDEDEGEEWEDEEEWEEFEDEGWDE